MLIHHLPEVLREDQKIIHAVNQGYTVYVANQGDDQYTVVVMDGKPVANGGDFLAHAPKGTTSLYMIIPGTPQGAFNVWNVRLFLYTVEDYRQEITPPAQAYLV